MKLKTKRESSVICKIWNLVMNPDFDLKKIAQAQPTSQEDIRKYSRLVS